MTRNAHLRGIGGPGAPHVFSFDRRADLEKEGAGPCCEISMLMNRLLLYSCHLSNTCLNELCILQGIDMSGCVSAFWRRLLPTLKPHDDDVILRPGHHSLEISLWCVGSTWLHDWFSHRARTKQHMSDPDWQDKPILYLPAEVCRVMKDSGHVPEGF